MKGEYVCLCVMAISLIVSIWIHYSKQEKAKKDATKIVFMSAFLGFVLCITEAKGQRLTEDGRLIRNENGEGDDVQQVQLTVPGVLEDYDYTVEVKEKRLYGEDMGTLFDQAVEEAETIFLGNNKSLDEIRYNVSLPRKLQNGQVQATWSFDPEGIIDEEGTLHTEELSEDGKLVMVSLILKYYDNKIEESFGCMVYPKMISPKDQVLTALEEYFSKEDEVPDRDTLALPKKLEGYTLKWSQKPQNTYQFILMLGVVAAVAVGMRERVKEQQNERKRKEQLLQQYADMVSKLSLLLGAGMTVSGAWERIALTYQRQRSSGLAKQMEVYEQMLYAYHELKDGMGEQKVYEHFGERCGTPQYRKLTALIIQNLRKGSMGLTKLLEREVAEAFELRKNHARKAGEEAGTKLLLPMVFMLCIVMVIVLVPAFLSFQVSM